MNPVRCPTCELVWNIPDDAPAVVTCPRCLAALNNPYRAAVAPTSSPVKPAVRPPPLPIRRLEQQVQRDTRFAGIGLILIILVVLGGIGLFFVSVAQGAGAGVWGTLALLIIVASALTPLILVAKKKPVVVQGIPMAGVAPASAPAVQPGGVLEYGRPAADSRKLSSGAFFAQAIGGIIVGIIGCIVLVAVAAQVGNGAGSMLGIVAPIAAGAVFCTKPSIRGFGVGLILALPVAFLLLLGFCAILMSGGSFH